MAAYAAVISLKNTIQGILESSHIAVDPLFAEIIQVAGDKLQPLQEILERLDSTVKGQSRKTINVLDGRIKEAVWRFEDLLESHLRDPILSQLETHQLSERPSSTTISECSCCCIRELLSCLLQRRRIPYEEEGEEESQSRSFEGEGDEQLFSIDLPSLQQYVDSFIQTVECIEKKYIYELDNLPEEEVQQFSIDLQSLQQDADSFIQIVECMEQEFISELDNLPKEEEEEEMIDIEEMKSKMLGLSDQFEAVKKILRRKHRRKHVYALLGMAGIGKTTLAKEIFEDVQIRRFYEHRVWVKVGRKSRSNEYYAHAILAQVDPNNCKGDEKEFGEYLKEILAAKNILIVFDDVWEAQVLQSLLSSLPDRDAGITQILLTARDRHVMEASISQSVLFPRDEVVRFMNEEESEDLLCKKVFGEEGVLPSRLEQVAKKIIKKCEGLPLLIVAVADRLSKGDMTEEYWNAVAEQRNSVFRDALDEISEVLSPSYEYLPQYLKFFFLYLGVFHPDCEITPSKLIIMLTGEGWFLDTNKKKSLKKSVAECLEELCTWRYHVLFKQRSIFWFKEKGLDIIKTCRLHSSWRHLCQEEAWKSTFFRVLNRRADSSKDVIKGQRCLCLHNNILFAIKDVHDAVQRNCASSTRSLLCFGPYHQYPVPIDAGFKLLRELDALKLRFYTFPTEILELVQLKYLALTCNGEIPATISKLFNLRVLIVHPHTSIIIRGAPSYIPVQIWDMKELEYIEILGRSFPSPHHLASMDNVSALVGVNANICNISDFFSKFPNIGKLDIRIEQTPNDDDTNLLKWLHHISKSEHMHLDTLKCSIVNPKVNRELVAPPTPSALKFPQFLLKLHLSGMGFPWHYIDPIGKLPFLEVLKLRCYAFRGSEWYVKHNCFQSLNFLLIEDSDLVKWTTQVGCFRNLNYLSMKHCYKLKYLPQLSVVFKDRKIELIDCNPLAMARANQLQQKGYHRCDLSVTSSF